MDTGHYNGVDLFNYAQNYFDVTTISSPPFTCALGLAAVC
jgi:hypothetical protein